LCQSFPFLFTLNPLLEDAERRGYAVGSFSPRTSAMILPVLKAGQAAASPLIVQISQKELDRYQVSPKDFAAEFFACLESEQINVPVALHLDHTRVMGVIEQAIEAGFTSVMIDASEHPLWKQTLPLPARSSRLPMHAAFRLKRNWGASGQRILSKPTTTRNCIPGQMRPSSSCAKPAWTPWPFRWVQPTGYTPFAFPTIDLERLKMIRQHTTVHMVLHGGSGVPAEMMRAAIQLAGGGVSKVNIATDLELAALAALGREKHLTDAEMSALPAAQLAVARSAVEATVLEKMKEYLGSAGKAQRSVISPGRSPR
jgi:fructose/tagatose bisphosphate aldolase